MKKKSSAKSADNNEENEIIACILRDHKPLKELIKVLKDVDAEIEEKRFAFSEFSTALTNHAKSEEESLYVYMKEEESLCVEGLEGDVEHGLADQLIEEIHDISGDDNLWVAKVKVLAELVEHHIKEEESEMLKEVKKEFNLDKRLEIGEEYTRLMSQYQEDSLGDSSPVRTDVGAQYVS